MTMRKELSDAELKKVIGGVEFTFVKEPDEENPGAGIAYVYKDGTYYMKFVYR